MTNFIDKNYSQSDMFDEDIVADIALRRILQFRLNFWINICKFSNNFFYHECCFIWFI